MEKVKTNLGRLLMGWVVALTLTVTLVCAQGGVTVKNAKDVANGQQVTVEGYIIGEPLGVQRFITDNFKNDYSLVLADSQNEQDMDQTILIKIPSSKRSTFGLRSNSDLVGRAIKVTGKRQAYFGQDGIKDVVEISFTTITNETDDSNSGNDNPTDENTNPQPETVAPIDSTGYYDSAKGKTGAALKAALNDIIDNHTELSYSKVWVALRDTDEDPNNANNVILLYTGRSDSKYNNGGGVNNWNREHVWAKSHGDFGTRAGAGTDLHHLRPTDVSVNSTRSNLNFDEGGTRHREATECFYDRDSFEPRDEVKGDVARMIFYMATRYEGEHGEVDLEVVNYLNQTKAPYHGLLSTLLKWHAQDPVSDFERSRNNKIYENWQGNRNPFIDHPEWVNLIWN